MSLVDTIKKDGAMALYDTLKFVEGVLPAGTQSSLIADAKDAIAKAEAAMLPVIEAAADLAVQEIVSKMPGGAVLNATGLTSEGVAYLNSVIEKLAAKLPGTVTAKI